MLYIKILSGGEIVGAEAHDTPAYVKYQTRNHVVVRCSEQDAQGILSKDGAEIYQLAEKATLPGEYKNALPISMMEYDELGYEDTEDTAPVMPDEDIPVMTRAELTAKVRELEEQLAAAKILLGVSE